MLYGLNRRVSRAKVPVDVIRGFSPTEPNKLSSLAPPIDDEEIRSGMVIVKATGDVDGVSTPGAYQKAQSTDAPVASSEGLSFYIALHDQDSHDVQEAGGLVGLDCSDEYEIQTGYYDPAITWTLNLPLTVGDDGIITEAATAGDVIIGYITKIGSGTNNTLPYVGKTPSTAAVADAAVIQFKTARSGVVKLA